MGLHPQWRRLWTQQGTKLTVTDQSGSAQIRLFRRAVGRGGNTRDRPRRPRRRQQHWSSVGLHPRRRRHGASNSKLVGTGYVQFHEHRHRQRLSRSRCPATATPRPWADPPTTAWKPPGSSPAAGRVWSQQGAKLAAASCSVALSGGVGNILLVGVNAGRRRRLRFCPQRRRHGPNSSGSSPSTPTTGGGHRSVESRCPPMAAPRCSAMPWRQHEMSSAATRGSLPSTTASWTQNGSKPVFRQRREQEQGSFGYGVALSADGSTAVHRRSRRQFGCRLARRGRSSRRRRR